MQAETSSKPIGRASLSKKFADSLRLAILNGEYALGERLREPELARIYEVSNSVLREGLHQLQGEGLLVGDTYKGKRVFTMTPIECWELTVARASLESLAAYLAAQRITAESARRISKAAEKFRDFRPTTYADHASLELEFHQCIWKTAGNDWLEKLLNGIVIPLLSLAVQRMITPDVDIEAFCRSAAAMEAADPNRHELLAKELINGEADKVRTRMIRHITEGPVPCVRDQAIIMNAIRAIGGR